MTWSGGWTSIGDRSLQPPVSRVPGTVLHGIFVSAYGSRGLQGHLVLDEVDVIVDEGSTVSNVTQDSELRYLCFDARDRVYKFLAAFSDLDDALSVVEETRENYGAKYRCCSPRNFESTNVSWLARSLVIYQQSSLDAVGTPAAMRRRVLDGKLSQQGPVSLHFYRGVELEVVRRSPDGGG